MKKVILSMPTVDELMKIPPMQLQETLIDESEAKAGVDSGVAVILNEQSISIAKDGKSAILELYVVIGNSEDVKNAYKLYYPEMK